MKARIAALEGQAKRADATQKALRKYVGILEKKVKDQSTKLKEKKSQCDQFDTTGLDGTAVKQIDRETMLQQLLGCKLGLFPFILPVYRHLR